MTAQAFSEHTVDAADGLRLYYRAYGDPAAARLPLLCLPGLTRNSKDFHDLACRHAASRRVIAVDYRGRGRSAYDPEPANYNPMSYLADLRPVLAAAGIGRAVLLGTSMGGLLALGLAATLPALVAGIILNDVGPDIDAAGYNRIAQAVGNDLHPANYEAAAELWRRSDGAIYPRLDAAGWLELARATYRDDESGHGVRLDYDPAVGAALRAQAALPLPDLWPLFRALQPLPMLVLRGALSDVLSAVTLARMRQDHPGLTAVTIPDVGHVPMLDEPAALAAIDDFLAGF